jgi:hypothetical protein
VQEIDSTAPHCTLGSLVLQQTHWQQAWFCNTDRAAAAATAGCCVGADAVLTNLNASLLPMGQCMIKVYSLIVLFYLTTGAWCCNL